MTQQINKMVELTEEEMKKVEGGMEEINIDPTPNTPEILLNFTGGIPVSDLEDERRDSVDSEGWIVQSETRGGLS